MGKALPSLTTEQTYWHLGHHYVAGVDEVGRGCLAGPVVAGAVLFSPPHTAIPGVQDSKQLSFAQRSQVAPLIKNQALAWAVGEASVKEINDYGIVTATLLAMDRALTQVEKQLDGSLHQIIIDGKPITLTHQYPALGHWPNRSCSYLVKGDQRCYSIAAASILAKVYRDQLMTDLASSYPDYTWEVNKGYGTLTHRQAVLKYGLTPQHRVQFCRKLTA